MTAADAPSCDTVTDQDEDAPGYVALAVLPDPTWGSRPPVMAAAEREDFDSRR